MAQTTTEHTTARSRRERARKQAEKKVREKARTPEVMVIEEIMQNAAEAFRKKKRSVSVAEYLRLMQMRREIEGEPPEEVRVTWVEQEHESATET
jgi:hypothetical protein